MLLQATLALSLVVSSTVRIAFGVGLSLCKMNESKYTPFSQLIKLLIIRLFIISRLQATVYGQSITRQARWRILAVRVQVINIRQVAQHFRTCRKHLETR